MQHIFEYIIEHRTGEYPEIIHKYIVTESSRFSKVAKKILKEENLSSNVLEDFKLRKIR